MGKVIGFVLGFLGALALAVSVVTNHILPLVPPGEYQGLIQLCVVVACVFFGGGLTIAFCLLCGTLLALIVALFTDGSKTGG